jgi:hypothetical protein
MVEGPGHRYLSSKLRSGAHAGIALVRPDGYTAYEAYRDAPSAALESVREVLERQIVGST